ncbi:F-box/FBD/LRR-repeat protein At1g13570 [Linum grandiflorum]
MFLDLKDAAKTSILSRKWRHYWKTIPKLEFDDYFAEESEQYDMNKILLDIYKILLLHDGPITKFVLSINGLMPCNDIDPIIRYVSEKGVQHLSLSFVKDGDASGLKISSSLFYAVQLNHLALEGGLFVSPSWFVGFNRLKVLEFNLVKLPHDIFEKFIPMCPLVEDLRVSYSGPCPEPVVVAPRLKVFVFEEYLDNIVFKCTPLLAVVSIQLTNESFIKGKEGPDMVALFASLPALQQLYVNLHFLNLGASEHVPVKLPTVLSHLRLLSIYEGWEYMDELETKVLFCLLKSSPRLHRIILSVLVFEELQIPSEPFTI